MKEKQKFLYEAPRIQRAQVELEGGFMTASVMEHRESNATIRGHEIGTNVDFEDANRKPFEEGGFDINWDK